MIFKSLEKSKPVYIREVELKFKDKEIAPKLKKISLLLYI